MQGDLNNFRDDLVFKYEDTGKNLLFYCEQQQPQEMCDYLGNKAVIEDISGCCIVPTTYVLGKSNDYASLLSENSARRSLYKE